ncbi:MAG: molybdate ABC transporter substrate-binding protein [Thermoanaerobaculia bacterium]|nr:molybdate ABC transporter substrate-binding protein [Thermoanaerobaculia bacterium]
MSLSPPTLPALLLLLTVVTGACGRGERQNDTVRVFAAASLTEVVTRLTQRYDGAEVVASFGSSSSLARQIRDGAPADVFLSASPDWVDFVRDAGELDGEPVVLARNRLVAIVPTGSRLAAGDAASLLRQLDDGARVAIADEGVPVGEYARAALRHLGLLAGYTPHLVGLIDVRGVLHAVETGEMEAGFVYSTDAALADVDVLFRFDPATHPTIEYQAAVLRSGTAPEEARRFLGFLLGEEARAILSGAGFALP